MFSNKIVPESPGDETQDPLTPIEMREAGNSYKTEDESILKTTHDRIRKRLLKIALIALAILIAVLIVTVTPAVVLSRKGDPKNTKTTAKPQTTSPSNNCPRPSGKIGNGNLSCTGLNSGNTCSVKCNSGYNLAKGTGSQTCQKLENGNLGWFGKEGVCEPKPCSSQPVLSNNKVQNWVCDNGLAVGSTCVLNCLRDGYKTSNAKSTCLVSDRWTSNWSECIAVDACATGMHNCSLFADCQSSSPGMHSCTCKIGYAGSGFQCSNDTDSDGIPDSRLDCSLKSCLKDNCVSVPNSGQEDLDKDGKGDACDMDDDSDGISDKMDNCPLVSNPLQNDTDSDGVGDACDNCRNTNNTDQLDTNANGIGDACEVDADGDNVNNTIDNCPVVFNPDQSDRDSDGVGDVCDNCPEIKNQLQIDLNDDLVGDSCEVSVDSDSDGISDNIDNCLLKPNSDQIDTDKDGVGDVCDSDKDNDGMQNLADNCPLVPNPNQGDENKNGVGDACENDDDGDGVTNEKDDFPLNANKSQTDFRKYNKIVFDDKGVNQPAPKWFLFDQGKEILQTVNGNPGALIGKNYFDRLVYTGTLMIQSPDYGTRPDDDYVGILFGFQSNRNFYVCSWKKKKQSYSITGSTLPYPRAFGRQGISLKKFHSLSGPGESMRDALWETGNSINQSTILWHDQNPSWQFNVSYQWHLIHDPDSGRIRIRWYQGKNLISDSGDVIDKTLRGGRVGVYVFSQENVYFSAMRTKTLKASNYALELDGKRSFVDLGKWSQILDGSLSFMIDLWIFIDGTSNITCETPELIDFGSGASPQESFLTQDESDELEWYFTKTNTPSPSTGPSFDHTTGNGTGYYSFFNSQWDVRQPKIGDRARLLTPWFPATNSCSLNLFIHMWDGTATSTKTRMGSFQIDVRNTEGAWNQVLWVKGNQSNVWHERSILLKPTIKSYEDMQVRFTAVRSGGSQGDVAMDDLRFGVGCGLKMKETCENNRNYIIGSTDTQGPSLFVNRGKLIGGISANETLSTSNANVSYGSWNHVAMSFNNSANKLAIYLNGIEAASKTVKNASGWNTKELFIGRQRNNLMKGIIDDIRVWKVPMNITSLYTRNSFSSNNLLAYYRLNEGEGNLTNDLTNKQSRAKIQDPNWIRSFVPNR